MLQFLKRLFCFHHYDYESDIFIQDELAERITANKAPRILDVEGFSFLIGGTHDRQSTS